MAEGKSFPLSVIISAVDRISGPMRAIAGRVRGFQESLGSRLGLARFQTGIDGMNKSLAKAGDHFGSIARMARNAAIAIAAVTAAAFASVNAFAAQGDEIAKTADRLGISAETLQEWRFAAERSGVDQGVFNNALKDFNKNIGQAAAGTGEAKDVIAAMDISLRDATGNVRSMDDLLPEVADKLAGVRSASLRAAAAGKIFGEEGGAKLVNMLALGSKGIDDLRARARELGIVMSQQSARDAEEFADRMTDVKSAMLGLRVSIGGALLPVLSKLADQLTETIVRYRPQIEAWSAAFAKDLPARIEALVGFMQDLGAAIGPIISVMSWLNDVFGLVNLGMAAFAALIAGKLVLGIAALTSAMATLGITMAATPIGWIIGLVTALTLAGIALYNNWDKISAWWGGIWGGMKDSVSSLVDFVTQYNPLTMLANGARELGETVRQYLPDWVLERIGAQPAAQVTPAAQVGRAAAAGQQTVRVEVDLNNLPRGTNVNTSSNGNAQFDVNQGFALQGAY